MENVVVFHAAFLRRVLNAGLGSGVVTPIHSEANKRTCSVNA